MVLHGSVGVDKGMAVRLCLLSAAVWWAGFTLIPYLGIRNRPVENLEPVPGGG